MSQTEVVNVKVAHIRPQYDNLEEWMKDPQNAYIGRGRIVFIDGKRFPAKDSLWANPYKGDNVVNKYENYIRKRLLKGPLLVKCLLALEGKRLGCWCKPKQCHGDVLLKLISEYKQTE